MDRDALRVVAERRGMVHARGGKAKAGLGADHEYVALVGEWVFSERYGYPIDTADRVGGDNGVDFRVPGVGTVDVKTARKPTWLLVERGKVRADIYVLARYDDASETAELLGWAWGSDVARAVLRDMGYGIVSHAIEAGRLRSIEELDGMMGDD